MSSSENIVRKNIVGILEGNWAVMRHALERPQWMEGLSPNILFWLSYCPNDQLRKRALEFIEEDFVAKDGEKTGKIRHYITDGTRLEHVRGANGTLNRNLHLTFEQACLVTDRYGVTPLYYATIHRTNAAVVLNDEFAEPYISKLIANEEYLKQVEEGLHDPEELGYIYGLLYLSMMRHEGSYQYAFQKMSEIFSPFDEIASGAVFLPLMFGYLLLIVDESLTEVPSLLRHYPAIAKQLDKVGRMFLRPIPCLQDHINLSLELLDLYKTVPREHRSYFYKMEVIFEKLLKPHRNTGTLSQNIEIDHQLYNADLIAMKLHTQEENWVEYKVAARNAYQYLTVTSDFRRQFELLCNITCIVKLAGIKTGQEFRKEMNQLVADAMTVLDRFEISKQDLPGLNDAVKNLVRRYAEANLYSSQAQRLLAFMEYCFTLNPQTMSFSADLQSLLQVRNAHRADVQFVRIVNGFVLFLMKTFKHNSELNPNILYIWSLRERRESYVRSLHSYDAVAPTYDEKTSRAVFAHFQDVILNSNHHGTEFHFANACGVLLSFIQHHSCRLQFRDQVLSFCHALIGSQDYSKLHPSVGALLGPDAPGVGRSAFIAEIESLSRIVLAPENQDPEEPMTPKAKVTRRRERTPLVASPNGHVSPSKLSKTSGSPFKSPRRSSTSSTDPVTPKRLCLDDGVQNVEHANTI